MKKNKKICKYLNYVEHLLILVSTVTCCLSISAFASLDYLSMGIMSSVIGIKICEITSRIKKYMSIVKKKKKKEDNKLVLLVKSKLNTIKVLISEVLIDSCNCHDEFVPVNN